MLGRYVIVGGSSAVLFGLMGDRDVLIVDGLVLDRNRRNIIGCAPSFFIRTRIKLSRSTENVDAATGGDICLRPLVGGFRVKAAGGGFELHGDGRIVTLCFPSGSHAEVGGRLSVVAAMPIRLPPSAEVDAVGRQRSVCSGAAVFSVICGATPVRPRDQVSGLGTGSGIIASQVIDLAAVYLVEGMIIKLSDGIIIHQDTVACPCLIGGCIGIVAVVLEGTAEVHVAGTYADDDGVLLRRIGVSGFTGELLGIIYGKHMRCAVIGTLIPADKAVAGTQLVVALMIG